MSAALTPHELAVGVLVRAGDAGVLDSLVDASLHCAVVAAMREGSLVTLHPSLASHRPDALTWRRVPGLDDALRDLARDGALHWQGTSWALRSHERRQFSRVMARMTDDELAALDALARCWQDLVTARSDVARTASATG